MNAFTRQGMPSSPPKPICLCVDTAGPACQAVLSHGEVLLASRSVAMRRGHGEALVVLVEEVLADAKLDYEDVARIGVTVGPGSFTGMRVALAAARAFSATLNAPTVPIGTLEALALSDRLASGTEAPRGVSIDARNSLVYAQRFAVNGEALDDPAVLDEIVFASSLADGTRLVGPASNIIAAVMRSAGKQVTLGQSEAVPSVEALARLTAMGTPEEKPVPLYLKEADAVAAKLVGLRANPA